MSNKIIQYAFQKHKNKNFSGKISKKKDLSKESGRNFQFLLKKSLIMTFTFSSGV